MGAASINTGDANRDALRRSADVLDAVKLPSLGCWRDFGLEWNVALEAGGSLVGDEGTVMLDVELVKRA